MLNHDSLFLSIITTRWLTKVRLRRLIRCGSINLFRKTYQITFVLILIREICIFLDCKCGCVGLVYVRLSIIVCANLLCIRAVQRMRCPCWLWNILTNLDTRLIINLNKLEAIVYLVMFHYFQSTNEMQHHVHHDMCGCIVVTWNYQW